MRTARRFSISASKSLGFSHSAGSRPTARRRGIPLDRIGQLFSQYGQAASLFHLRISASTRVIRYSRMLLFLFRIVLLLGDRSPPHLPASPSRVACTDTPSAPQLSGKPIGNNEAAFSAKSEQDCEAQKKRPTGTVPRAS